MAFTNILVHVDTLKDAHPELDRALELARQHGAKLTIVDVVPEFSWPARLIVGNYERVIEQITHTKGDKLKELVDSYDTNGVDITTRLLDAPTSVAIVRDVIRNKHDLVIRAAKGKSSRRLGTFGTTATRLFRKCPCPVLLLKAGHTGECHKVVAAVDASSTDEVDSKLNRHILDMAQGFASKEGGQLDVVHVWEVYGEGILKEHMPEEELEEVRHKAEAHAQRKLDELLSGTDLGLTADHVTALHGDPGLEIPRFVNENNADLLVLGTVGRAGVAGLLIGNTAERILEHVDCSILAVKPEEFVSPITVE